MFRKLLGNSGRVETARAAVRPVFACALFTSLGIWACGSDHRNLPDGHLPADPKPVGGAGGGNNSQSDPAPVKALIFTRTAEFRHPSIDRARDFFEQLDDTARINATLTEDPTLFREDVLRDFDVVVFANTTGDVLDDAQQEALQRFVRSGKGFVGVHAAADTEKNWPWYGELLGGVFVNHPEIPLEVEVTAELPDDPSSRPFADLKFKFKDEWYNFDRNPRETATILLTIDESGFTVPNTPEGPSMGADHPVAWFKQHEGGRVFYTNLGHRLETWDDQRFQQHLLAGVRYAAYGKTFSTAILTRAPRNPVALAVTPTGNVYYIERTGEVRLWELATGHVRDALVLTVDTAYENGLLGLALDPRFGENGFIYLYASMPVVENSDPELPPGRNVLARYTARADGSIEPNTRLELLSVPSERHCCHEGGALAFTHDGLLLVSSGDNTNPFDAEGFAPLDARPGRELFNSRRTAANPFDLRGKLLRIRSDGTIPDGNLFADPAEGLPAIYAMGLRNPFRIAPDPILDRVFVGDIGPDGMTDSARGPRGYDEVNLIQRPGDFGWPLCIGPNLPYSEFDFSSRSVGAPFECEGKVAPLMAYDYSTRTYPALGKEFAPNGAFNGRAVIAGGVYRANQSDASAFPTRFQGSLLLADWTRNLLAAVQVTPGGELERVERLLPSEAFPRPIDIDVGPDGSIYVLQYGSGFWGDSPDAGLLRIEYADFNRLTPEAVLEATPKFGVSPLRVHLSGLGSSVRGPAQSIVEYAWDLDGDGTTDAVGPELDTVLEGNGPHHVSLRVKSSNGQQSLPVSDAIVLGNSPPSVQIIAPAPGTRLTIGTPIRLRGDALDAEDGAAPCEELTWNVSLVHNTHAHPVATLHGCSASFLADPGDHTSVSNEISYAVELVYTDHGGPNGEAPLTAREGASFEVIF